MARTVSNDAAKSTIEKLFSGIGFSNGGIGAYLRELSGFSEKFPLETRTALAGYLIQTIKTPKIVKYFTNYLSTHLVLVKNLFAVGEAVLDFENN